MGQYLQLLRRNDNYRNLWLGNVVSLLGDWFNLIASATLIASLTSSGVAISYLFLSRFFPVFLFSPVAGVLADRFSRRLIMISTDLLRAVVVLGFLLVRRPDQVWLLYALTVAQFTLSAMFTPARSAVLANVVEPEELVTANALDNVTWSTMLAIGAMLGGVVAGFFGRDMAFIMDGATFLVSAFLISRVDIRGRQRIDTSAPGGWLSFVDGMRYLRGVPVILIVAMVKGAGSLIWGVMGVVEITFAEEIFPFRGNPTLTLGIFYTISGIGTGIGPLVMRHLFGDTPARMRWAIVWGFGFLGAGMLWISWAPTLPLMLAGMLLRTLGTGGIWVFSSAILQTVVPDRYRGRVFAFEFAFLTLTQSFAILWAGWSQDLLGMSVRQVVFVTAWPGLMFGVAWLLFHLRLVRRREGGAGRAGPAGRAG